VRPNKREMNFSFSRAPDKVHILSLKCLISSPNPMIDHLLESSNRDDSKKWSNRRFYEEIKQIELNEVHFTHLIWCSDIFLTS